MHHTRSVFYFLKQDARLASVLTTATQLYENRIRKKLATGDI